MNERNAPIVLEHRLEASTETFEIQPGARTLEFDLRVMRRIAIGSMLAKYINAENMHGHRSSYSDKISEAEKNNLIGMAIGYYQVELGMFYPGVKDKWELNDDVLMRIIRWGNLREQEEKENTDA